jgi:mannose/fructose-specific phosphotransferase system component IIA
MASTAVARIQSKTKTLIHLAESETGLITFCDLIGGYLYLANQVEESGFDSAEWITAEEDGR